MKSNSIRLTVNSKMQVKFTQVSEAGFCSVVVVVPLLPETWCNRMVKLLEKGQFFKQKSRIVLKYKKSFQKQIQKVKIFWISSNFFFLKKFEKVQILKPATKKQKILGRLNREDTFKSSKKLKLFYRGNHNVW